MKMNGWKFSYTQLKKIYLRKSPLEKYHVVGDFNAFSFNIIGLDFMDSKYKKNFKILIPTYIFVDYISLFLYTLYYYRHQPLRALQVTPSLGITIPSFVVFCLTLIPSTRKKYRKLYNFGRDSIYKNSDSTPVNRLVCDRMAIKLIVDSMRMYGLVILSFGFIAAGPFYKLFFTDEKELVVPAVLPFIDPDTDDGFYINFCHQLITMSVGLIIIPAIETITCIMKNNISASAAIIDNDLVQLDKTLQDEQIFSVESSWQFRNIIRKIIDFDEFVIHFTELYYWKFLLQPGSVVYAVSLGIFFYLLDGWITGIGTAICCYIQLLILCNIGKSTTDANELILDRLNQFRFYMLPVKKQIMYQMILCRIQNGTSIRMGPLSALNYETATGLTKTIYSYTTIFIQTMGK